MMWATVSGRCDLASLPYCVTGRPIRRRRWKSINRRQVSRRLLLEGLERRNLLTGTDELADLGLDTESLDPSSYYDVDFYDANRLPAD